MKKLIYIALSFFLFSINIQAQKGKIEGRVFDYKNNQPLPFSNIVVTGTNIGATSDFDGKFVIINVDPGFVSLSVSSLGYETRVTEEFQVNSNKPAYIDVALNETSVGLETVVVSTKRFVKKEESPVSMRTIGPSLIENSPGANRDISKVIQSLPGIASIPGPNRNDIIVRGGASNESKFYLDDVEIPTINHFATQGASGGTNGIINADFVRELDFYSGAFPASRGNALSGIFNFKQISGNKDKIKARTSLGASETSLTLDGPLSDKTTYIFSVRRSYLQFLFKVIGLPFLPTFNDYQLKTQTLFDDKNELRIISIGSLDQFKLDTDIQNPDENQRYILNYLPVYDQWSYTIGAVYKHYRKNGFNTLVLSRNMLSNRIYKYTDNDKTDESKKQLDYVSEEIENKFRYETLTKTDNNWKISGGINMELAKYNNNTFQRFFTPFGEDTAIYNSELNFIKWGLFAQTSKQLLNNSLTLSLGIRSDANSYSKEMNNLLDQISPRFSASYVLTDRINLNFNTGRYYQLPAYTSLGYRNNEGELINKTNGIRYISADHIVAGVEYIPSDNLKISAEGFYKSYNYMPFSVKDSISLAHKMIDFGTLGDEEIVPISKGHAYGTEFLIQANLKNNLAFVVSYTFAISEFQDKNQEFKPTGWDNRHIFISTLTKKFKNNWYAGFKWRYAGGLPYTPYDLETSAQKSAWDLKGQPYLDLDLLNSQRFRPFHQLDLRVDKTYYYEKSSLKIYIDIQNFYNFKSDGMDRVTNLNTDGVPVTDPSNESNYELRVIENEGDGTVLPTIGIIFDF